MGRPAGSRSATARRLSREEWPYWEEYFKLTKVQDAHDRRKCKDRSGSEPWACSSCDCTERLERKLKAMGRPFLDSLRRAKVKSLASAPAGTDQRRHLAMPA